MKTKNGNLCPCGTQETYLNCCAPYIKQKCIPETALALMRSRYTAYTQANIAYIQETMSGKAAENYHPIDAYTWAKTAKWKELKILRYYIDSQDNTVAYVEFVAEYDWGGKTQSLHELSCFQYKNNRWFYVDMVNT